MPNEVYTDLENTARETAEIVNSSLYGYVFHFNHFTGLWSAIPRELYSVYWNDGNDDRILRSKSIDTLIYLLHRSKGDLAEIVNMIREQ